jgi:hypothetical protein
MRTSLQETLRRGASLALLTSATLVVLNVTAANAEVTTDQPATDTQVAVFTVDPVDSLGQLPADLAAALDTAESRANADPSNLAPPYVLRDTGTIVAPVASSADTSKVAYASEGVV